jgi:outer membrane protein assembly factor BamA
MLHTETAYSGTADVEYRHTVKAASGFEQDFAGHYSLRSATRILDSEFVYSRHLATADYALSRNQHYFGVHFIGGSIGGRAPLFERFSFGNSSTLRGWNKFDVAPLGGDRAAHGSLEYRYKKLQLFYDVGSVWDAGREARVRHGIGFGLASKSGFFASLAFPVRLKNVAPVFMIGFRGGR